MRVALVTGANKGIGLQVAKELAARGFTVLVGARELARGHAAAGEIGEAARAIAIDVTDAVSILTAAEQIRRDFGRLDVLVNNAGISRASHGDAATLDHIARDNRPSTTPLDEIRAVFETNAFGPIAVIQAMLPLLLAAPAARIVNVSSGSGSLGKIGNPQQARRDVGGIAYGPSKNALNAATAAFAIELAATSIKVNAADPGFTATDFNEHASPRRVADGARVIVKLATLDADGPTGTFWNDAGIVPW
jgi:NAD(P)-dependent dehydrogenase (short-subunit alcohol dehydrogenase family)